MGKTGRELRSDVMTSVDKRQWMTHQQDDVKYSKESQAERISHHVVVAVCCSRRIVRLTTVVIVVVACCA